MTIRLRAALAAVAVLAGCASGHPLGIWYALEPATSAPALYGCVPVDSKPDPCVVAPAPSAPEQGPSLLLVNRIGFRHVTAADGTVFFSSPNTGAGSPICSAPTEGGPVTCFASVPHLVVDLLPAGEWLLVLLGHHPEGPALARVHRARREVEYQRIGDEGQSVVSASVDGAGGLCVVLARPGAGSRELGLERVRLDGSAPPRTLVPYGQVLGDAVACDATDAYFNGRDGLARVPLGGGAEVALGTSASHIALGPGVVYVATVRGIEQLPKGSTELRLIAPVADAGLGWNAVPELFAVPGGVAWHERLFPNRRPDDRGGRIRRCVGDTCDTIVESPVELELVAADSGVLFWTEQVNMRLGRAMGLFAARGPKRQAVAGEAGP